MLIIDRYLLRQFLQVFAICFCSLTGLFIVIDAFANLEEFIQYGDKQGNMLGIMVEYYGYRSLSFFNLTSSTLTLIAAMFTVAWLQRFNELTALMAAGVPKSRILRPVIIAVGTISLLAMANREILIPSVREKFSRNAQDLMGEAAKDVAPHLDRRTEILLRGKMTFAARQQIHEPNFLLPVQFDAVARQIVAQDAFYQPPQGGRPGGYLMKKVSQPRDLGKLHTLLLPNQEPVVFVPLDAPWLAADECFVVCDVTFEQLTGGNSWRQFSSTIDLIRGLRDPGIDVGEVPLTIHTRLIQPLMDMTLLFLGLPLVLRRESRNMFLAIGLCMSVVLTFMLVNMMFQYLGSQYLLSPSLAAWAPLMIFVPIAVALSEPLLE